MRFRFLCGAPRWAVLLLASLALGPWASAAQVPTLTRVTFDATPVRAVRMIVRSVSDGTQPCVDEFEVYGPGGEANLALASAGARASASSCLQGHAAHAVEHLNDGRYGNAHSWISAEPGAGWAQIDFPGVTVVDRVVISRDRLGQYPDRRITALELRYLDADGQWRELREGGFVLVDPSTLTAPPPPPAELATPEPPSFETADGFDALLREAFLREEYAALMAHGRVDFHPVLSRPSYGIERPGPRHAGDDRLPLPKLEEPPVLDGALDDEAWRGASRGVVRVASLVGFGVSPLVEQSARAGVYEGRLFVALETPRLLSAHAALVSSGDWQGCGAVVIKEDGRLDFAPLFTEEPSAAPEAFEGAVGEDGRTFEFSLPLTRLPGYETAGVRIGLGLGGKYVPNQGRPLVFAPDSLAISQVGGYGGGEFKVRLSLDAGAAPWPIKGNVPALQAGITLVPGESRVIAVPAASGPLGPEATLEVKPAKGAEAYALRLFRYASAARCLSQGAELCGRLEAQGLDVADAERRLESLRTRQRELLSSPEPGGRAERRLLQEARRWKRDLFMRDPALAPAERILFVKRRPFRPSHNYSVILDAPWNPGGGVCALDIPRRSGRLKPEDGFVTMLFDAGGGLARTPMADFECENVYFAYKPSADGYFHIYRTGVSGGELEKLTDGPFHDYWPCPLPDGGIAFISTRCKRRFLCWRPQAATLHRMDADGGDMRILSHANLTEWAPSVMDDGRILWTRSEYQDKAADFGHTLWAIRPDGTHPELIFGNTITKTNGYANGRFMPNTNEVACTLISHFGDLNGPIALLDIDEGRFDPGAISSITPEVFWPGPPPATECFRDPVPISEDHILVSHAADARFDLYVIDRYGNRELLYADPRISSMCPTPLAPRPRPPVVASLPPASEPSGEFIVTNVYEGLEPHVRQGEAAYLAVSVEVSHDLDRKPDGSYRADYEAFQQFYASPSDVLTGPHGWPTYAVKERLGIVPIEPDGSARFKAPSGCVLYFHVLDQDYNELQRMRSVVQLQPGEKRSCIGCHEDRDATSERFAMPSAMTKPPRDIQPSPWGRGPFSYERIVQPVLDANCVTCHDGGREDGLDLTGARDQHKIPASYRTFIEEGLVHYADWTWNNPDVCRKAPPRSLGVVQSRLFELLEAGHYEVELSEPEMRALKTWVDLNCPLWGDYVERSERKPPKVLEAWQRAIAGPEPAAAK